MLDNGRWTLAKIFEHDGDESKDRSVTMREYKEKVIASGMT